MSSKNLYFIAIIPPQAICEEVTAFKHDFEKNYNSSKALRIIPHITLKPPFHLKEEDHAKLLDWFRHLNPDAENFAITLDGFGSFSNSKAPVLFVKPKPSPQLNTLQKDLIKSFENHFPEIGLHYHEKAFNPHMTIAYRDLSFEEFKKAWHEYSRKNYKATFEVTSLYLLQHDTKEWNIICEYILDE